MKSPTPDQRAQMVRILREIKADVTELRVLLERLQARRAG
jgi:hypothetical protein